MDGHVIVPRWFEAARWCTCVLARRTQGYMYSACLGDLSRTLLRKSGTMDIQNYMSLFRACGRERNAKKALDLLTELEQSAVGVDTTASRKQGACGLR